MHNEIQNNWGQCGFWVVEKEASQGKGNVLRIIINFIQAFYVMNLLIIDRVECISQMIIYYCGKFYCLSFDKFFYLFKLML